MCVCMVNIMYCSGSRCPFAPAHVLALGETPNTIMCTAHPTTMYLKAVCYHHTRTIEVHTTVTFVLFPTANQYIRSSTSIEQNILLCSTVGVTQAVAENVSSLHPNHFLPALTGSRQRPRSEPSPQHNPRRQLSLSMWSSGTSWATWQGWEGWSQWSHWSHRRPWN